MPNSKKKKPVTLDDLAEITIQEFNDTRREMKADFMSVGHRLQAIEMRLDRLEALKSLEKKVREVVQRLEGLEEQVYE